MRKEIQDKLHHLDKQIDQDGGQEDLLNHRRDIWKDLLALDELREKHLVQKAKVKWAIEVWDCGKNKSPGPDGVNFEFVRKFWDVIGGDDVNTRLWEKILANRLSSVIGSLVSKEQTAFIRGRQILDCPLILSEVIDWCNQKKNTWRVRIKGCLVSSSASVLMNRSPTQEFYFEQGLRQGDPFSPFLFLLVMEALHISFVRAMDGGFFKENLRHLVSILQCFYLASGLRINIHKCSIMGVGGVTNLEVNRGAQMIGCEASKIPFNYLGIMIGGKMNLLHSWDVVYDKVMARLSKWKAKTFSIGGRFTLTKSILSVEPGTRKVTWFSWDSVVASKDVGGLGMSFFFAMNCALLFKWIWRFKVQPEAMWVSVIKAIHKSLGSLHRGVKVGKSSTWLNCIRCISNLKERCVDLYICMKKKVGDGSDLLFWIEYWLGEGSLDVKYPRLFALEENKQVSIRHKVYNGLLHGFRRLPRGEQKVCKWKRFLT
uniref:RNA-directed DNA polymerase, eukaryota n=1 Tax=Tanacetum cinerariifolium TaxID=118510 RepID=A0A699JJX9_TANCI|nr:RNA-directed DNA polymerase, eukaryota [Tanacetum cinerariifolium]